MKTFFNISEAADWLRVREETLIEWIEDGTGPQVATSPGEMIKFHVEDLRLFEESPV